MKKTIFLSIIILMLAGLGCSSNKTAVKKTATPTAIVNTSTTKTKPITPANTPAEKYCVSKGNELILRYNPETKSGESICRFPNTEECETETFLQGTCDSDSGSKSYLPIAQTVTSTICTTSDPQVCGINNRTYANHCSAEREGVLIKHTGSCAVQVTATTAEKTIESTTTKTTAQTTTKTTTSETTPTTPTNTDWLNIIKEIITSQPTRKPPAYISKCKAGQTVYFISEGCSTCASNLYTEAGSFICNPSNDIGHICPSTFDKTNCTVIWRDNR